MRIGLAKRGLQYLFQSETTMRFYWGSRRVPLVGKCLHRLVDRVFPHWSRLWIRISGGAGKGLWFYGDPRFEPYFVAGHYEPWVQRLLQNHLGTGGCFYDVGAHRGFFSLIAGRIVGSAGWVAAFEPDPENAAMLRQNATANKMTQVQVIESAVWSCSGSATFTRVLAPANGGCLGHVSSDATGPGCEQISVPAVSLDDLIFGQKQRPPWLIKMDVEGAEWEILQGARRTLAEIRPHLVCEVHQANQVESILSFLADFGYTCEHWNPADWGYPEHRPHYVWTKAC